MGDVGFLALIGGAVLVLVLRRPAIRRRRDETEGADGPLDPREQADVPPDWAPTASIARRLYAVAVDSLCLIGLSSVVFALVPLVQTVPVLRVTLVVSWLCALVLYDPVLVSLRGGTLGHAVLNLHVVDDRHGGPPGLLMATWRYLLKATLGLFSYVIMIRADNDRALHDRWSRTSVRIKDQARAHPFHYAIEPESDRRPDDGR